ncbi:hypothetical protein EYW49_20515 [Siculibacillus lacustris]|uniref:Uncharacterized protein n=1 Tax=Siculibacillus lacustris TaxID=1549641 RepID=A0A4Q9VGP2_9HYPH|nr:hypothetical protein [Siculibacillus lacustris]TBW33345.1 hypothetical protein EYW49_20515 [Siculibacillus lacustris]
MSDQIYYDPASGGFYSSEIHGSAMPSTVVEITGAQHAELLAGLNGGKAVAIIDGVPELVEKILPVPTAAEIEAVMQSAVGRFVQSQARGRGYDGAESCASYVASTNATWSAEAKAFVAWRDAVWASALATLAAVRSGAEAVPTVDAVLAALPPLVWPD